MPLLYSFFYVNIIKGDLQTREMVSVKCSYWGWSLPGFISSSLVLFRPYYASVGRRDRHFHAPWLSEPHEVLTICRCWYKGSAFSLILRLWVLFRPLGFKPRNLARTQKPGAHPSEPTGRPFWIGSIKQF